ncbi:metallophosphoesterase family protein [Sulfitobacter sp. D35]|uniref:metallophosphoesterase family protein n=1 Tax=Sulfitobacter sp. D35 TaxID=3083252 RepID=UPI00296E728C|nr:metallophosphoesterase family protein [Sulfitobacter sp. D35]MDW4498162.1 metallophosphoesterase family protein [Sulfitobacter sp. D35]
MSEPIYAIGDIHGRLDELHRVMELIEADGGPDARVVLLGDYVDRGPESAGVIDFLAEARRTGRNWVTLMGNHDRYLRNFIDARTVHDPSTRPGLYWFDPRLGGDKTMASYGVEAHERSDLAEVHAAAVEAVPDAHREFLASLPTMHVTDDLICVHAGIRPGVPLEEQDEEDLVWIRQGFLEDRTDHGRMVVHGHTALDWPTRYVNRVNLDGGAGYFRNLHAAVFEGRDAWLLSDEGRQALPYG